MFLKNSFLTFALCALCSTLCFAKGGKDTEQTSKNKRKHRLGISDSRMGVNPVFTNNLASQLGALSREEQLASFSYFGTSPSQTSTDKQQFTFIACVIEDLEGNILEVSDVYDVYRAEGHENDLVFSNREQILMAFQHQLEKHYPGYAVVVGVHHIRGIFDTYEQAQQARDAFMKSEANALATK